MLTKKYRVAETCSEGSQADPCQNEARCTSIGHGEAARRTCTIHATGPSLSDDKAGDFLRATVALLDALERDPDSLDHDVVAAIQDIRGIIGLRRCPSGECQIRQRCTGALGCTGQYPRWTPTAERPLNIR